MATFLYCGEELDFSIPFRSGVSKSSLEVEAVRRRLRPLFDESSLLLLRPNTDVNTLPPLTAVSEFPAVDANEFPFIS